MRTDGGMAGKTEHNPLTLAEASPGTPFEIDGQWVAFDGLGAAIFAPSWQECTRIVQSRTGEATA